MHVRQSASKGSGAVIRACRAWLAHRRRMRAAESMDMLWTCWLLFFSRLHEKPKPGPAGMLEYRFHEAVQYHRVMVRPLRWWR